MTIVGQNLRSAREAAGMSQEAVARIVGGDADYVRGIEQGRTDPSTSRLIQLAHAIGVDPADLLAGT